MLGLLPDYLVRTVSLLLEDLDTPVSLGVYLRVKYQEWDQVASLSIAPSSYLSARNYLKDAQAVSLLKKLKQLPTKVDRRAAAIEKWWQGERECYKTNERLRRYLPLYRNYIDREGGISEFISEVRKIIVSWIGPRPTELCSGRFGPGATYSDRGDRITVPHKMSADPSLTRDACWFLPQWFGTQWGAAFAQRRGEFVWSRGNRYATVPKTALTDRSIASEPSINVFYQLSMGSQIRRRLKRNAGWDLDRAQEIHRRVARESSVSREFTTLDLSNASDTVSSVLVELLMPQEWFETLDSLRSKLTHIDDHWVRLEKFSSMGNGFTFELETLIFAALACAVARRFGRLGSLGVDVFVFGDDIIFPDDLSRELVAVLAFFGFTVNEAKSFRGSLGFRESCGGDFFLAKDVRPYFLKEIPDDNLGFIGFANGLAGALDRLTACGEKVSRRAWFSVLDSLPTVVRRCRGPKALGDIVIHDREDRWYIRVRNSIRYIRAYRPHRFRLVPFERFEAPVVLACATYGTGNRRGGVVPRDGLLSSKVGWVPYS